jgi:hypothetical protein
MTFAQIIKDRDFMTFIQQLLRANAADVTRSANEEDFHGRRKCRVIRWQSKRMVGTARRAVRRARRSRSAKIKATGGWK